MKKLLIGLTSICLAFSLTGCGEIPELENGEDIVASIDGKDFTANELYNELKKQGGASVLVNMIDTFIINQEVTSSKEAEDYADSMIEQYKLSYEQQGASFTDALISSGYANEDEFRKVIINDYMKNEITEKYIKETITEDDLKDYYEKHISDELSVKHILIAPESSDSATEEEKTNAENAALEKAKNLIEQLNNGADFDTLAKENSDDEGSASNGGLINNVVKEGYVTEFWEAAYALENEKYTSEPVKTEYGYHIIYKVSHTAKQSFEDMKDSLYDKVVKDKLSNNDSLQYKTWADIRAKYNLAINDSTIDSVYNNSIKGLN